MRAKSKAEAKRKFQGNIKRMLLKYSQYKGDVVTRVTGPYDPIPTYIERRHERIPVIKGKRQLYKVWYRKSRRR